eukprot:11205412-Lingulodinium_polyedra.AAC.1
MGAVQESGLALRELATDARSTRGPASCEMHARLHVSVLRTGARIRQACTPTVFEQSRCSCLA